MVIAAIVLGFAFGAIMGWIFSMIYRSEHKK